MVFLDGLSNSYEFMMTDKSFVFSFDDVEVREREFSITKGGKALALEPKAFRALLFLLHNPQKLISKDELLNSVWGNTAVTEASLTRSIWLVRNVLKEAGDAVVLEPSEAREAVRAAAACFSSVFRAFGAMPPPRYIPPVASTFNAMLPVSAP